MCRTHFTHRLLESGTPAITVLSGLGGSGKTQIALKFAKEFEEMYLDAPVFFLNAQSEESLKTDFEILIRSLGNEHRSKSYQDALVWLAAKPKNWLIILDNADDPGVHLFPYIPKCSFGNIIITTRNSTHSILAPTGSHEIEGLSTSDSVALILRTSGCSSSRADQSHARKIVEELGHLPLALAQAAGYIFIHKCLSTYLAMYRENRGDALGSAMLALPQDYPASVAGTIQVSMNQLSQDAYDLMRLFAQMQYMSIAHSIIAKSAERRFEKVLKTSNPELNPKTLEHADVLRRIFFNNGTWSEFKFNELVTQCLQYSLLRLTTQGDEKFLFYAYSGAILSEVSSNLISEHQSRRLVVRLLGTSITLGKDYEFLAFNRLLVPHLRLIHLEDLVEAGDHVGFGDVFYETGDRRLAVVHQERCVDMWRALVGDRHGNTLGAMVALANSYTAVGRSQEALKLEERVLTMRMNLSGTEHPDTMIAMHNLAVSYTEVGRKMEAMRMEEHVLEVRKKILGPDDPLTLSTMSNLAASYSILGRDQDALKLQEEVLDMQKIVLGPEHPDTLDSMYNLATSYSEVGRVEQAVELEEKLVQLRTKVLGLEHPDTVDAMWNLSCSLKELRLKERRLDLLRTALPLHERAFGWDHWKTIEVTSALKQLSVELS